MTFKAQNTISLAVIGIIALGIGVLVWMGWRELENGGYEACIYSVMGNLHRDLVNNRIEPKGYAATLPSDRTWRVLTSAESAAMLSQARGTDCGRTSDITKDLWGKSVNLALRRTADKIEVVIWSEGRDGLSGTSDDIIVPYGHEVPK